MFSDSARASHPALGLHLDKLGLLSLLLLLVVVLSWAGSFWAVAGYDVHETFFHKKRTGTQWLLSRLLSLSLSPGVSPPWPLVIWEPALSWIPMDFSPDLSFSAKVRSLFGSSVVSQSPDDGDSFGLLTWFSPSKFRLNADSVGILLQSVRLGCSFRSCWGGRFCLQVYSLLKVCWSGSLWSQDFCLWVSEFSFHLWNERGLSQHSLPVKRKSLRVFFSQARFSFQSRPVTKLWT